MRMHVLNVAGDTLTPIHDAEIQLVRQIDANKATIFVRQGSAYGQLTNVAPMLPTDEAEELFRFIKNSLLLANRSEGAFNLDGTVFVHGDPYMVIDLPAHLEYIRNKSKPNPLAAAWLVAKRHGLSEDD